MNEPTLSELVKEMEEDECKYLKGKGDGTVEVKTDDR